MTNFILFQYDHLISPAENGLVLIGTRNINLSFMVSEFFGRPY